MAINFPNNPTPGQLFVVGNRGWRWNDTLGVWESFAADPSLATASTTSFDTQNSDLVSDNVQSAIEELEDTVPVIASLEEAEAGTENTKFMTPLRTAQSITELSSAVTVSNTAPSNAKQGDLWWDNSEGVLSVYFDEVWVEVSDSSKPASVTISTTEPQFADEGDLWWDSTDGTLYVYYNQNNNLLWVEVTYGGDDPITAADVLTLTNTTSFTPTTDFHPATKKYVDDEISLAQLALGTNYVASNLPARDALTDLVVGDLVFVVDSDGEDNWAQYKVVGITDGLGSTSNFEEIMSQVIYTNVNTKEAIKSSYESNADTNAFTDALLTKLNTTDIFDEEGTYANLRAQATTATDVSLGNVTNESKATMFTNPTFTGQVAFTPSTLGTTGTINIDFAGDTYRTQAALTGDITYTGSNYANGRGVTIRVINGGTQRSLTFPAGWRFVGAKPANIAANKIGVLTLAAFGTNEADVVAGWAVEV